MGYLQPRGRAGGRLGLVGATILMATLGACTSLGSVGPSANTVKSANGEPVGIANIQVIDVTDAVARRVLASSHTTLFSEALGEVPPVGSIVGRRLDELIVRSHASRPREQ